MEKRILYIGNALSSKGATVTSVETLGIFLKGEGYVLKVASSQKNKILRLLDMIYHIIRFNRKTDYVLIDTYSTTNFWYAVIIGRLCSFFKLPYIPILGGGDLPKRLKKSPKYAQKLFGNAYRNIAPSPYMMSSFEKKGFANLTYIPNTIEIRNYPFIKRENISPKLLWVRSFSKIYNPLMALKVLEELLQEFPEATLTMVGPDKDDSYQECLAFAKANKLPVTFTGLLSKEEWIALAASHDVFISTTNFDNTPVSVIEAMALGLPIISTDVGGMPFLIEHAKDGLLSSPNEVASFVLEVTKILKNPSLGQSLAKNARSKVEHFDWSSVKRRWEEVLS